jgi:hypothetical protein
MSSSSVLAGANVPEGELTGSRVGRSRGRQELTEDLSRAGERRSRGGTVGRRHGRPCARGAAPPGALAEPRLPGKPVLPPTVAWPWSSAGMAEPTGEARDSSCVALVELPALGIWAGRSGEI